LKSLASNAPGRLQRIGIKLWMIVDKREHLAGLGLTGFAILGRQTIPVIPELCQRHALGRVDTYGFKSLFMTGDVGLIDQLKNPETTNHIHVMECVRGAPLSYKSSASAASVLIECLQDADRRVAESALCIMKELHLHNRDTAPALLKACVDSDRKVRIAATNALRQISPTVFTNGVNDH